ncbi:hypothetical protein DL93DRAFT_2168587 [Clavulina sp. PMI_390]|nr:hypothetical protein DL93DRAFT_2168587 [Clavulina sp. PMI_390]
MPLAAEAVRSAAIVEAFRNQGDLEAQAWATSVTAALHNTVETVPTSEPPAEPSKDREQSDDGAGVSPDAAVTDQSRATGTNEPPAVLSARHHETFDASAPHGAIIKA